MFLQEFTFAKKKSRVCAHVLMASIASQSGGLEIKHFLILEIEFRFCCGPWKKFYSVRLTQEKKDHLVGISVRIRPVWCETLLNTDIVFQNFVRKQHQCGT